MGLNKAQKQTDTFMNAAKRHGTVENETKQK